MVGSTHQARSSLLIRLLGHLANNIALQLHRDEDNLRVPALRHCLQRLKLPNLHSSWASEDISSLPHQPGRVDFCPSSDDLGLSDPLLLSGRGEGGGNVGGEDDVFDEDALDGDTPSFCDVAYDLSNLEGDGFALGDDALDGARTDDVTEGRLSALGESLAEISDTKGGAVGVGDLVIDYRVTATTSMKSALIW